MDNGKLLLFLIIFVSLVFSVIFSMKSFTGYLVSDIPDVSANLISFVFLVIGLIGSFVYVRKFRGK